MFSFALAVVFEGLKTIRDMVSRKTKSYLYYRPLEECSKIANEIRRSPIRYRYIASYLATSVPTAIYSHTWLILYNSLQACQALADACYTVSSSHSGNWDSLHSHAYCNDLQCMVVPQCMHWSRIWVLYLPHPPAIQHHY